jgi:hypothetical protein
VSVALCAALAGLGGARAARAQGGVTEGELGGTVVAARQTFGGVEFGIGRRSGQGVLALSAAPGDAAGVAALRLNGTADFVLWPSARTGRSPYAGLGVTVAGRRGSPGAGYVTAVLGIEGAPAGQRSWFVEAGLAGGVRAAAGIRWRHAPAGR